MPTGVGISNRSFQMQSVRVIAGLGNPGPAYDGTRHNIGYALVNELARVHGASWQADSRLFAHTASIVIANQPVFLLKPQTFMNLSGKSIGAVCRYFKWSPQNVLVAYDEYQIPLGRMKLTSGGSAGGHNGIASIIGLLGPNFPRFRMGIAPMESQDPNQRLTDFVLGKFSVAEHAHLTANWDQFLNAIKQIIRIGPTLAANLINQRIQSKQPPNDA